MKAILLICIAGCAVLVSAFSEAPAAVTGGGTISGKVTFDGEFKAPAPLTIGAKESEGCCPPGIEMDSQDRTLIVAEDGALCNVVVTLTADGFERVVPTEPVVLDQKKCRYEPHVVVVPMGAKISYRNSDGVNHNVHTYSKKNQAVNKSVASNTSDEQLLEKDEAFEVKCDIHPWMLSNVYVTDATHYAVTGPDGKFSLRGVPAGKYKVEYWHARLGKGKTDEIEVTDGGTASVDFALSEKKKGGKKRRR